MEKLPQQLPERLLEWYAAGHRDLPWRRDREPYHVWLSEVMLQQTRVEAVKGYYRRFLAELPDIPALAACPPDRLAKLWEGLGYYSRMRNLQKAAQVIVSAHGGVFPREYDAIRALPGVGDYTAGAIASICFGLPEPAVDGNVLRVLSRVTDDAAPVTDAAVKREYAARLREIYPAGRCGDLRRASWSSARRSAARTASRSAPCARWPRSALPAQTEQRFCGLSRRRKGKTHRGKDRFHSALRHAHRRPPPSGAGTARRAVGASERRRKMLRAAGACAGRALGRAPA